MKITVTAENSETIDPSDMVILKDALELIHDKYNCNIEVRNFIIDLPKHEKPIRGTIDGRNVIVRGKPIRYGTTIEEARKGLEKVGRGLTNIPVDKDLQEIMDMGKSEFLDPRYPVYPGDIAKKKKTELMTTKWDPNSEQDRKKFLRLIGGLFNSQKVYGEMVKFKIPSVNWDIAE